MSLKTVYARPRVDRLLAQVTDYPLVSVVAGAGYGKTTAAHEFLGKVGLPYAWVTLTTGDADVFWDKLSTAIGRHDRRAADSLRAMGVPEDAWQVSRVVKLTRECCTRPFIVCIDDYQLLPDQSSVHTLVETLAFEEVEDLHVLLLSRAQPNIRIATLASKGMALCIDADALAFDVAETEGYLAMRGLRLTSGAVRSIHDSSCGWVSAIYLLGEGIRAGGQIGRGKGIDALFEENLMATLPEIDRDMLCRISAFDSFPLDMAVCALGMDRIRDVVAVLMRENAFITKDDKGEYRFHPLLREYLYTRCPQDVEQGAIYRRAALWYAAREDRTYFYSVELVRKAGCVEEYLEYFNRPAANRLNYNDMDGISRMAMELPDDTCLKYPFPYLQICFFLLLSGERSYLLYAGRLLSMMREHYLGSDYPYRDTILGEIIIISRITGFGQVDGGGEPLEEAARLLGGRPSEILDPADPFTFGLPMLLHSEFMKAGTLDETVARCQYNPYELVSDGFGRGSEPLVRAEAALLRCDTDGARRYAEQALCEASQKEQYFIMASARSTLMRRSLFLGDTEEAVSQVEDIRLIVTTAARMTPNSRLTVQMLRETLRLAECFLNTSLMRTGEISPDSLDGSHQSPMAGLGVPQMYAARAMYSTGNPAGALRLCERMDTLPHVCQAARIYSLILLALCREKLDERGSGLPALITALTEAQQDGIVLPFAENPDLIPLLSKVKCGCNVDGGYLDAIRVRCEAFLAIAPVEPTGETPVLSKRELEVLRLVAQGRSRSDVAVVFHVQENTIKAQLSSAYRKLGARGRTDAVRLAKTYGLL